jgi:uncharacterized repeat protein (TIGR01451 family)
MNRAWFRLTVFAASVALLATGLIVAAPVAQAATTDISSSGPLTDIWVSDTLGCQVAYQGDAVYEWYSPGNQEADCGTSLYIGPNDGSGIVFGAQSTVIDQAWTPVSQSAVTGSGTSSDPYTLVTIVKAIDTSGDTPVDLGIQVTQTDTYVVGEASYRTDIRVDNTSGSALQGVVYRLGDCYLQGSDSGYGIHDTTSGAVGCRASQDAAARVEEWVPITFGSHYYESGYFNVVGWPTGQNGIAGARGTNFPDSSADDTPQDNGTGISWSVSIPDGGHSTFSELSAFSPTGNVPLTTSKTADQDTAAPGAQDGYTITVHNSNTSDVTLNDVTDNLPTGFSYVTGSSTNASTHVAIADPSVDPGNNLTWNGPFTVPSGGDFSLHFNADVSNTTGNYKNQAGADAAGGYSVAPTGPTAQVQVTDTGGSIDADLQIAKSDAAPNGPDPVTAGNDVSYQIEVTNNGPDDSTGVAVTDDLPPGTSFVSATGDGWTCDFDSESDTVFCTRDSLANGDTSSLNVVLQAPDPAPDGCEANGDLASCITDSATVDFFGPDDQFDPQTNNNTATQTTEVQPRPQNPDQSTGYVPPEGGKVSTGNNPDATDNTDATVKLPPGPGGVVNVEEMTPPPDLCVNGCTGQAVEIDIPDGYTNQDAPAKTILKYDTTVVRPKGGAKIYIKKGNNPAFLAQPCLEHGVANPSPCVGARKRLANGDLRVTVLLLSGDPLCGKH